jgi:hypothetical protein
MSLLQTSLAVSQRYRLHRPPLQKAIASGMANAAIPNKNSKTVRTLGLQHH